MVKHGEKAKATAEYLEKVQWKHIENEQKENMERKYTG